MEKVCLRWLKNDGLFFFVTQPAFFSSWVKFCPSFENLPVNIKIFPSSLSFHKWEDNVVKFWNPFVETIRV